MVNLFITLPIFFSKVAIIMVLAGVVGCTVSPIVRLIAITPPHSPVTGTDA